MVVWKELMSALCLMSEGESMGSKALLPQFQYSSESQTLPDGGGNEWSCRLPSFISTFIAQDILVCPNEVAVPREEVCRAVDDQGLVNVHGDKVIISTS